MTYRSIDQLPVQLADGVLSVTLNRPDTLNSLTEDMLNGIADTLEQAATDPAVRVVKLSGAGRGFIRALALPAPLPHRNLLRPAKPARPRWSRPRR